jgi:hypothetical protein
MKVEFNAREVAEILCAHVAEKIVRKNTLSDVVFKIKNDELYKIIVEVKDDGQ